MRDTDSVPALEKRQASNGRLFSPSTARNRAPIAEAFGTLMPTKGLVLEVGSGTGEHGAFLCGAYPSMRWQPSDPDAPSRLSCAAWADTVDGERMRSPLDLDVTVPGWWRDLPEPPDALFSANMIHIAPPAAQEGLFRGASALLRPGGRALLYGPFSRRGAMTEGNRRFSAALRARDASFGVRDLDDDLQPLAARFALALMAVRDMPTGNLCVLFEKN